MELLGRSTLQELILKLAETRPKYGEMNAGPMGAGFCAVFVVPRPKNASLVVCSA